MRVSTTKNKLVKTPGFVSNRKQGDLNGNYQDNSKHRRYGKSQMEQGEFYGWTNDVLRMFKDRNNQGPDILPQSIYENDCSLHESSYDDLIRSVLFINRAKEWFSRRDLAALGKRPLINYDGTTSPAQFDYPDVPNPVERAIFYGQPRNVDELIRCLIPNEKGLWEHRMVTKKDLVGTNKSKHIRRVPDYCIVCNNEEARLLRDTNGMENNDLSFNTEGVLVWPFT